MDPVLIEFNVRLEGTVGPLFVILHLYPNPSTQVARLFIPAVSSCLKFFLSVFLENSSASFYFIFSAVETESIWPLSRYIYSSTERKAHWSSFSPAQYCGGLR